MEVALLSPPLDSPNQALLRNVAMSQPKTTEERQQVNGEYGELLAEFVRMFETIPQKYCLFCEAKS